MYKTAVLHVVKKNPVRSKRSTSWKQKQLHAFMNIKFHNVDCLVSTVILVTVSEAHQ